MIGQIDLRTSLRRFPQLPGLIMRGAPGEKEKEEGVPAVQRLVHKMPLTKPSEGIVFIKLDFTKLFTHPSTTIPPVRCIKIIFEDDLSKSSYNIQIYMGRTKGFHEERMFKISKRCIGSEGKFQWRHVLKKVQSDPSGQTNEHEAKNKQLDIAQQFLSDIFPVDRKEAMEYLQKKLWIEVNVRTNRIILGKGDLQKVKNIEIWSTELCGRDEPRDWSTDVDVFPAKPGNEPKMKEFGSINQAQFEIEYWRDMLLAGNGQAPNNLEIDIEKEKLRIVEFMNVEMLDVKRFEGPVVERNPSLLNRSIAPLSNMTPQIQLLYEMLERLCLYKLPQFELNEYNHREYVEYTHWNNAKFAIHNSLTTPYGYYKGWPVGVLNHMFKIKSKRHYEPINFKKVVDGKEVDKSPDEIKEEIYKKRAGYLRFEVIPTEGLSPGSPAVFEIWPPYHCSSIHNHGDADGLIKVLGGAIRVENFKNLSHQENKPYMVSNYRENNYTWLTAYSFGIHRLINVHAETCLTLQAYANVEGTHEFFTVLGRDKDQPQLKRYYPQHDWRNYLNYTSNKDCTKEDRQFIQSVIQHYKMFNEKTEQLDCGFMRFMLAMKQEFEVVSSLVD